MGGRGGEGGMGKGCVCGLGSLLKTGAVTIASK